MKRGSPTCISEICLANKGLKLYVIYYFFIGSSVMCFDVKRLSSFVKNCELFNSLLRYSP
ncbi:hypothetical protein ALTER154_70536 [Alteromonas sp. 154]|nr:hypothetical protein ALTER154_70536 [Alteromonas sp. 154]